MTEDNGALDGHGEKPSRRDFIYIAAGGATAVGGGLVLWPFVDQMNPAADTLALGSIRVDVSQLLPGSEMTVMWRGAPVFIRHRTEEEVAEARDVELSALPDEDARNDNLPEGTPAIDANRVLRSEFLIVKGNCTHLGCVPTSQETNAGGEYNAWYCPCHGSHYDKSARIRRGPAPENLPVPDYFFESETTVKIGLNDEERANSGWAVA
ncbi:ubiquinol-cytochrome c reductase iron-sulfur subunit [Maricaulis sp.]|uniref:ubiquinol-cytochrome c reductase iron-sulfur subunit n=1 Tax=Maricaulis sp. TaxID=1486257 RepID=UPI002635D453|nr:ubiquinol-cytochrome c reductase iron-sulfur subunit [Maricaulis sp.]